MRNVVGNERLLRAARTLCFVGLVLLLCTVAVLTYNGGDSPHDESVTASAKKGFIIVVDAGHGGFDGGAVGTKSGVPEAGINLTVAKYVKELLEANGAVVILTRETEDALGENKRTDMAERKRIMNDADADAIVSVHMNKFKDASVCGPMAFYMKGSAEGEKLAYSIITSVCEAIGHSKRAANPGDYFMIRESPVPSAIIECGFLSNAADEEKLLDEAHQRLLAEGITRGILAYLDATVSKTDEA